MADACLPWRAILCSALNPRLLTRSDAGRRSPSARASATRSNMLALRDRAAWISASLDRFSAYPCSATKYSTSSSDLKDGKNGEGEKGNRRDRGCVAVGAGRQRGPWLAGGKLEAISADQTPDEPTPLA